MYTEWLRPLNGESPDELPRGEGKVIRRKTHPVAVYRDEEGMLHELSAVCPHLKCIVHWNTLEKSWDCPCHGSRFDAYGTVFSRARRFRRSSAVAAEERQSEPG